jgi:hypothetical protein
VSSVVFDHERREGELYDEQSKALERIERFYSRGRLFL